MIDAARRAHTSSSGPIDIAARLNAANPVEVAIRPESIRLAAPAAAGAPAKISNHVFLGNISEYYATLPSGLTLRVQTHPLQQFKVGEACAIEVDATLCTVFRAGSGEVQAA